MRAFIAPLLTVALPLNLCAVGMVIFFGLHSLHAENALLENVQALTLLLASFLYAGAAAHREQSSRFVAVGLSLLCFSFVVREIDVELLGLPNLLTAMLVGDGRTATLVGAWSLFFLAFAKSSVYLLDLAKQHIASGLALYLLASAGLLIASGLIDRSLIEPTYPRLIEEFLEMNAYGLLLVPACFALRKQWAGRLSGLAD